MGTIPGVILGVIPGVVMGVIMGGDRSGDPYRAVYAYAWDLAEDPDRIIARFIERGLNTISYAASYHAGKFLRPQGTGGKVYFPEDGTVYFRPDDTAYGAIRPRASRLAAETDWLARLAARDDIAVNGWVVLLHNSRLGVAHPEAQVRNLFGDGYLYSLCPSVPAVRDYAVALCRDISHRYPVTGLSLETPGFLPYAHGYHHEFALFKPNPWLDRVLGLCFCDQCRAGAEAAGIAVDALAGRLRAGAEALLAGDITMPEDMAEAHWLADIATDGELGAFLRWRCDTVTGLVAAIRGAVRDDATLAVIPSVARPTAGAWYEGSDIAALARAGSLIEACFYEPAPARIAADLSDVRRRLGGSARLRGILRPAWPDLDDPAALSRAVALLAGAGVEDLGFYNYGHWRAANLDWVGQALAALP